MSLVCLDDDPLGLIALWLAMVLVCFRPSKAFLIAGLMAIGLVTVAALLPAASHHQNSA
jgi:hypothetical protein